MKEKIKLRGSFTYEEYRSIIKSLNNIKNTTFESALQADCYSIIRHDVEFSIDRAHVMGLIDAELGIKSTFFFQVSSSAYNPFSQKNKGKIKNLEKLGHKIGLHFYVSHIEPENQLALELEFQIQKSIFEMGLGINLDIFSFHRPPKWLLDIRDDYLFNALNAYGPSFFEYTPNPVKIKYMSDSNHQWKNGHPFDDFMKSKMQLLIHPDEWSGQHYLNEKEFLLSLINENRADFISTLDQELKSFAPYRGLIS